MTQKVTFPIALCRLLHAESRRLPCIFVAVPAFGGVAPHPRPEIFPSRRFFILFALSPPIVVNQSPVFASTPALTFVTARTALFHVFLLVLTISVINRCSHCHWQVCLLFNPQTGHPATNSVPVRCQVKYSFDAPNLELPSSMVKKASIHEMEHAKT